MKPHAFRSAPWLIAAGVMGGCCLVQLFRPGFTERSERMTYDWRVRQAAHYAPVVSTNLAFVAISDASLRWLHDGNLNPSSAGGRHYYGSYLPRHIYGRVVRELSREGVKVSAFDVLFGELHPDDNPLNISGEPMDSDEFFRRQIEKAGNVLLASENGVVPPRLLRTNALALGDITADKDLDGILRRARAFRTYTNWHGLFQKLEDDPDYGVDLEKAELHPGQIVLVRPTGYDPIRIPVDSDGKFDIADFVGTNLPPSMERRQPAFTVERVWHMGIVLAAQQLGLDLNHADVDLRSKRITLRGKNGVERVIPVDGEGYFFINWCIEVNDSKHLAEASFHQLLANDQARNSGGTNIVDSGLSGKLAIIGSVCVGNDLSDRGPTPLQKDTFLVSKHWNVANSVLTSRFVRRAGVPEELALICLMAALAMLLTCKLRTQTAVVFVLLAGAAYVAGASYLYVRTLYWLPMVVPVGGGLLATHASLLAYLLVFERAEQRRVKTAFNKMVSPDVAAEVLNADVRSLEGARRNVTVLFSDIRGFTEMTDVNREKAAEFIKEHGLTGEAAEAIFDEQARETMSTVNSYLKVIAETVLKHHGTIDKFIGDCVMAFWGAPIANPKHATICVRAAIDIQRAVNKLNREREGENDRRVSENKKRVAAGQSTLPMQAILYVGTGINTGVVTVGFMGSDERVNYTVFGRDVNLASRLETVSGRGRIIISESTLAEIIQDDPALALSCVELPPEKVKGIREAVRIYEVPWRTGEFESPGHTTVVSSKRIETPSPVQPRA